MSEEQEQHEQPWQPDERQHEEALDLLTQIEQQKQQLRDAEAVACVEDRLAQINAASATPPNQPPKNVNHLYEQLRKTLDDILSNGQAIEPLEKLIGVERSDETPPHDSGTLRRWLSRIFS
jgi:hypothetical protein